MKLIESMPGVGFADFKTFMKVHIQYDSTTTRDAALIIMKQAPAFVSKT